MDGSLSRRQVLAALGALAAAPAWARADDVAQPAAPAPDDLAARMVLSEAPAQRVLYTWTTPAQIKALRAGGRLLHRARSSRHGQSRLDRALAALHADDAMSKRLRARPFRRFCWPSPWATLRGWPGETYGDQLLRVVLKPSWTAAVEIDLRARPSDPTAEARVVRARWGFFDADGAPRPAPPSADQVGSVYHMNLTMIADPTGTFFLAGPSFREYVIFDEAQVAGFSYGDDECRAALTADLALLDRLIADPRGAEARHLGDDYWTAWSTTDPARQIPKLAWARTFAAGLAWKNPLCDLQVATLKASRAAVAQALAAQGPPLRRTTP